jgi:hypothetical protein
LLPRIGLESKASAGGALDGGEDARSLMPPVLVVAPMRVAAVAGVVLLVVFAGCTGNEKDEDEPVTPAVTSDPFPGVNEALFRDHENDTAPALEPLAVIVLLEIGEGCQAQRLLFDGRHFGLGGTPEPPCLNPLVKQQRVFLRVFDAETNDTVALRSWGHGLLPSAGNALVPLRLLDGPRPLAFEQWTFVRSQAVDCAAAVCPWVGTSVGPLPVSLEPSLNVSIEGPASGKDALDQLEIGTDGGPNPRDAQNYTVTVEAQRFLRGRLRFDFDASKIGSVTPVTVAQNYSTAFVPLDGAHRLVDIANLTSEQLVVRQTFEFRIDFENGTAHPPTGGTEEQLFRVEAYAWTPAGEGRVDAAAEAERAVSVTMEVP